MQGQPERNRELEKRGCLEPWFFLSYTAPDEIERLASM